MKKVLCLLVALVVVFCFVPVAFAVPVSHSFIDDFTFSLDDEWYSYQEPDEFQDDEFVFFHRDGDNTEIYIHKGDSYSYSTPREYGEFYEGVAIGYEIDKVDQSFSENYGGKEFYVFTGEMRSDGKAQFYAATVHGGDGYVFNVYGDVGKKDEVATVFYNLMGSLNESGSSTWSYYDDDKGGSSYRIEDYIEDYIYDYDYGYGNSTDLVDGLVVRPMVVFMIIALIGGAVVAIVLLVVSKNKDREAEQNRPAQSVQRQYVQQPAQPQWMDQQPDQPQAAHDPNHARALEILNEQYAQGMITREEYDIRRTELERRD